MDNKTDTEKALLLVIERLEREREEIRSISGYPGTDELEKRNLSDSLTDIIRCNHQRYEEAMHRAEQRELKTQSKVDELSAQNERLRGGLNQAIELLVTALIEQEHITEGEIYDLRTLEMETPAASLAHVRAEAIEWVASTIDRRLEEDDEHPVVMLRGEAERIRQSAKQSGEQ